MIINKIKRAYFKHKFVKECDLSKIRFEKIKGNEAVADSKLYFYYDETENYGKMRIELDKNYGFNNNPFSPVFMLGGIYSNYEISNDIADELINIIKVKGNPSDIKFHNVFGRKCNFQGILKSQNLNRILNWIDKNNIYLHFVENNILYDITNTIYSSLHGIPNLEEKDLLRKLILKHSLEFSQLLEEVKYPDITDFSYFWDKLEHIFSFEKIILKTQNVLSMESILDVFNQHVIQGLKNKISSASANNYKLINNVSTEIGVLTDNLSIAYQLPLIIFKNSFHYFDNENVIKKILPETPIYIDRKQIQNYEFVNVVENKMYISKEVKAIYICDWIVRILHQAVHYLRENGYDNFYPYIRNMTKQELENFIQLCRIIEKSKKYNPFSFCFLDDSSVSYRFEWLIDYKETIMRASIYDDKK
jgi:hypothetical protein